MNFIQRITQMFSDPTIPIGNKIYFTNTNEFKEEIKYDYATIEKLIQDERVYAIVSTVASLVQRAYVGPDLHPENKYIDAKLTDKEKKAINEADKFARKIKASRKFFEYAFLLTSHGDLFEKVIIGEDGIEKLVSLPLNSTVVLEKKEQISTGGDDLQITEEKLIGVKKSRTDITPVFYTGDSYIHISYKNHGVWRKDQDGTETYGIYSIPPIASLQRLVNWKKKTIENDIIWKNKLLPRILHKLKMPSIVPSKYSGTQTEKVAAAKADADMLATDFVGTTKTLRPDDDLVISDAVETSILEAKSTNYHQPNETISQINSLLNTPQGISDGLIGGNVGASGGMELAAIFAGIRVKNIVDNIADTFTELMQRHLRLVASDVGEEVIERLFIHTDAALTIERFNKIKIAMSMAVTGQFTKGEVRQAAGYARLPQLPKESFPEVDIPAVKNSLKDRAGDVKKEKTESQDNNNSPQAVRNTTEEQKLR